MSGSAEGGSLVSCRHEQKARLWSDTISATGAKRHDAPPDGGVLSCAIASVTGLRTRALRDYWYNYFTMDSDKKNDFSKILDAIDALAQSTAKGFGAVDKRISALEHRIGSLEHQVGMLKEDGRTLRVKVDALPDEIGDRIDATYGKMLNEHEDRIRALEAA
ncbi:MAG: hypothetical protein MI920_16025 [Kiloniellales bacterium]|nr:hypothetical protein [Kiloniellales bacterium]